MNENTTSEAKEVEKARGKVQEKSMVTFTDISRPIKGLPEYQNKWTEMLKGVLKHLFEQESRVYLSLDERGRPVIEIALTEEFDYILTIDWHDVVDLNYEIWEDTLGQDDVQDKHRMVWASALRVAANSIDDLE